MKDVSAKIDYPLLKQSITVELNEEDIGNMEKVIKEIVLYADRQNVPEYEKKGICKKCAYYDLCLI